MDVERDDDSSRSFGLESEYYDHATIESAPQDPSPAAEKRQTAPKTRSRNQRDASDQRDSQPSRPRDRLNATTRLSEIRDTQDAVRSTARQARQTQQVSHEAEAEPKRKTFRVVPKKTVNTPAPDRTRPDPKQSQFPEPVVSEDRVEDEEDSESEIEPELNRRMAQPPKGTNYFRQDSASSSGSDAFERARRIPSDPRERDGDIQREIAEAEEESARRAREWESPHSAMRRRLGIGRWRMRYYIVAGTLRDYWPFSLIWRRPEPRNPPRNRPDSRYHAGGDQVEYIRLLYPMTYVHTVRWWYDNIMDFVISLIDRLSGIQVERPRRSSAERFLWVLALGGVAFFLLTSFGGLQHIPEFPDLGSVKPSGIHWPRPSGFSVGNIIPSVSWPSWGSGDDDDLPYYDPFALDDTVVPDDHKRALDALKKQANVHKQALKRLETILPRIVQMDLVNGRPAIKPEFWHALQDHLKEDGSFLNLEKKNGNFEISSEKQWRAIVARLDRDPTFKVKLDTIADRSIGDKLPNFWDTWFKKNNDVLEPLVEKAMAKKQSAGSGAAFDQKLSKIVSEELSKQNQTAVSRNEFLAHLRNDFAKHESQIDAEFARLKSHMDDHIAESIRTAKMLAPKAMSETEMQQIIRKIIYQTLTDGSLEAVAKSKIHAHWNSDLKHQVNFLGTGAGATIETHHTAPNWDPYDASTSEKKAEALGTEGIRPRRPVEALRPWQDEGDRWCGFHTEDEYGRPHGVTLSVHLGHLVIPENIVVEHIHPNATIDPDARPRHIEVFARFDFKEDQELVRDYSSNKFPNHINGWDFNASPLPDPFVKITQFEYQADELNDGVHVHHINDEFANLGIPTDHVIVRAMSNYGAPDHTCFYRVRLFGRRADELA